MDQQPINFIPLKAVTPEVTKGLRNADRREVQPFTNFPAPVIWKSLFRNMCRGSGLDWKGAGFVECAPEEVEDVVQRLADITVATNYDFEAYLANAEPGELAQLMLEGINHQGQGEGAYWITVP